MSEKLNSGRSCTGNCQGRKYLKVYAAAKKAAGSIVPIKADITLQEKQGAYFWTKNLLLFFRNALKLS